MGLKFEDLDAETRKFMLEEINADIKADKIYRSSYLTQQGQGDWPELLLAAAQSGTDDSLAASAQGKFNATTMRRKPKGGGYYTARVPHNAAEVLAESEFNRYFVRGLSLRAIAQGIARLQVYRAKRVENPRSESERKIGFLADPQVLLADVRKSQEHGVETALGIPPGPGSGITVRIPKT